MKRLAGCFSMNTGIAYHLFWRQNGWGMVHSHFADDERW